MDVIDQAAALGERDKDFALLHSTLHTSYSAGLSLLAHGVEERIEAEDFSAFAHAVQQGQWFGWLGYGLRHTSEDVPADTPSIVSLPALCMTRYKEVEESRHCERSEAIQPYCHPALVAGSGASLQEMPQQVRHDNTGLLRRYAPRNDSFVTALHSNMTRAEYLEKVAATIEQIRAGAFYQANITRKFYGELREGFSAEAIFRRLCSVSPAPYSAWIKCGDTHILSSSPELFLRITPDGRMITRPIKGSAPVSESPASLQMSEKDRAENLMIADLMRNDFSRTATSGSVRVSELFGVDSFPTIHHLSSTVEAELAPEHTVLEAITACFPPGSMTGAPKIAAMRWCSQMESIERGVYSGALGWISPDACELSVVIRTLVIQGNRFEFQVGGGIVADSDPEREWRETLTKAHGVAGALGIDSEELAAL